MQKTTTRSFLGRLLCGSTVLAMAAVVMPNLSSLKAKAAENYALYVAGQQVTTDNQGDILGDGMFCYEPSTKTLTVSGDYFRSSFDAGSEYAIQNTGVSGLVINVISGNQFIISSSSTILSGTHEVRVWTQIMRDVPIADVFSRSRNKPHICIALNAVRRCPLPGSSDITGQPRTTAHSSLSAQNTRIS